MIGPSGRKLRQDVVETNGAALVQYVRSIPGDKYLCLEEGTQSIWLYEILATRDVAVDLDEMLEGKNRSSWLVLARDEAALGELASSPDCWPVPYAANAIPDRRFLCTDDFSSILPVLRLW